MAHFPPSAQGLHKAFHEISLLANDIFPLIRIHLETVHQLSYCCLYSTVIGPHDAYSLALRLRMTFFPPLKKSAYKTGKANRSSALTYGFSFSASIFLFSFC